MQKSLSEQICKECGVKPLFLCKIHSETKCETVYPNFENPVNFKKLFDLKIQGYEHVTFAYIVSFKIGVIDNSEEFLKVLLGILQGNYLVYLVNNELIKQMKESIRNEQWEI